MASRPSVRRQRSCTYAIAESDGRSDIKLSRVTFAYPTRVGVNVLDDLSLAIPAGKSVAIVGPSACGKSTIVQLVERCARKCRRTA